MMGIFAHLLVYKVLRPESDTLRNFSFAGRLDSLENVKNKSMDYQIYIESAYFFSQNDKYICKLQKFAKSSKGKSLLLSTRGVY